MSKEVVKKQFMFETEKEYVEELSKISDLIFSSKKNSKKRSEAEAEYEKIADEMMRFSKEDE